jgi:hypothetical protein
LTVGAVGLADVVPALAAPADRTRTAAATDKTKTARKDMLFLIALSLLSRPELTTLVELT